MQTVRSRMEQNMRDHRGWYVFQGCVFLIFGLLAAVLPEVTALSATLFVGALLLASGIFQLAVSFRSRMHWWALLSAVLSIAIGGWMWWMPLMGMLALVVAVAIFFAIEGALEILLSLEFRPSSNWGWMLASGIATLALAVLLWSGWPGLSAFYLGILIAVNFIFYGVSLLMLAANAPADSIRAQ